ncbi:hypothetical protein KI688_006833 [Linnemannia hyalina]|uniref:Uncharacterized protein n=1 Tax=Linnemannia hyalina TaxID=64524 RepID=A0A9P7XK72_9FUNG|nr:hypothetical protein KI688_006833 [Linnemannia hyalina]
MSCPCPSLSDPPPEGQKVVGFFGNPMILMASFSVMMKQPHQAYSMEDSSSHDSFLNQPEVIPHNSEKTPVDSACPTTFGNQWAQQQPAGPGSAAPIQNKKQK